MREVKITKESVELYKILKFEGLVSSGGEAKTIIDQGGSHSFEDLESKIPEMLKHFC